MDSFLNRGDRDSVVILLAHGWSNLGDHAITLAMRAFLKRAFPERSLYVLTRQEVAADWGTIRAAIRGRDIIALPGGGNLGDLYPHEEEARLAVVRAFPHNRIISFPQSVHFRSDEARDRSAEVYSAHRHLTMMFRDSASHALALQHFRDDALAVPDIVFSSEFPFPFRRPSGAVVSIRRDDDERNPGSDALFESTRGSFMIRNASTIHSPEGYLHPSDAGSKVYALVDTLHAAQGLITDRLHGVILGIQAGIPVVAADNSYGKISGALDLAFGDRVGDYVRMDGDLSFLRSPRRTPERSPFFDTFQRLIPALRRSA